MYCDYVTAAGACFMKKLLMQYVDAEYRAAVE
jgi:hypothetical protein